MRRSPSGGDVIECETMPDHVHLLLELPPTVPLSALMQKMKGRSSRRLWAEFPQLRRLTRVVVTLMVRLDGWWSPARRCPPLRREPAAGQVAQCPSGTGPIPPMAS